VSRREDKVRRAAGFLRRVIVSSGRTGLILRLAAVVALVVVVAGPIAWNASVDNARKKASDYIAQASATINKARPATSVGTWEQGQLVKARAALAEAKSSYDSGSFFNRSGYVRAKSHANASLGYSWSIILRVDDRLNAAKALSRPGSYQKAIDAFFGFYKLYPNTTEAQAALDGAESSLLDDISSRSTVAQLGLIANFEKRYPLANLPSRTTAKARSDLLEIARAHYESLKYLVAKNRGWVHDMMNNRRASYDPASVYGWNTRELSTALKLARNLRQPSAMRRLFSLLRDGDRCGEKIKAVFEHPSSETSTSRTFSSGQVSSIGSDTDEIAANLSQERKLIARL